MSKVIPRENLVRKRKRTSAIIQARVTFTATNDSQIIQLLPLFDVTCLERPKKRRKAESRKGGSVRAGGRGEREKRTVFRGEVRVENAADDETG